MNKMPRGKDASSSDEKAAEDDAVSSRALYEGDRTSISRWSVGLALVPMENEGQWSG